jgi:hypothetical protein
MSSNANDADVVHVLFGWKGAKQLNVRGWLTKPRVDVIGPGHPRVGPSPLHPCISLVLHLSKSPLLFHRNTCQRARPNSTTFSVCPRLQSPISDDPNVKPQNPT